MVYVDNMQATFGRMLMCHMIADTHDELITMVETIGVKPKWIQQAGTHGEHFDICQTKRAKAVAAGAIEISLRDLAWLVHERRIQGSAWKPKYYGEVFHPHPHPQTGGIRW